MFFSVSMLMGLAMWAFMPVSGASYTSRTKALAVMAMVGMVMASVSIKNLKKVPTQRCAFRSVQRKNYFLEALTAREKGRKERPGRSGS